VKRYGNEPTAEPDRQSLGRAWKIPPPKSDKAHGTVAAWVVHAPHSNLMWSWYFVGTVHLRGVEGLEEPHLHFPGATHEIVIMALNPEYPLPEVGNWKNAQFLWPPDLTHQFIVSRDEEAQELTDLVVEQIVRGKSCDSDHRTYWIAAVDATAEHFRIGGHPA
jgi:hypothetical protein